MKAVWVFRRGKPRAKVRTHVQCTVELVQERHTCERTSEEGGRFRGALREHTINMNPY